MAATPLVFGDAACERVLATIPAGGAMRGVGSIAKRAGLSREATARAVARLVRNGEVRRERVGRRCGYIAAS